MKAWLVSWDGAGDHAQVDKPIATILNYRLSPEHVREIVEQIYVDKLYSVAERLAYAKNKKNNPYPAKFVSHKGIPFSGQIWCGDNPFLLARMVKKLKVVRDRNGIDTLAWEELPLPDFEVLARVLNPNP